MEYTKDLILKVRYSEEPNRIKVVTKKWTSFFYKKLKNYKVITAAITIGCALIIIDSILMFNFIQILEKL